MKAIAVKFVGRSWCCLLACGLAMGVCVSNARGETVEQASSNTVGANAIFTLEANGTTNIDLINDNAFIGSSVVIDVVNDSTDLTIQSVSGGGPNLFDFFPNQGIDNYLGLTNTADTTGYAGPQGNYFTDIDTSNPGDETGTIVFGSAGITAGQASFFSVEDIRDDGDSLRDYFATLNFTAATVTGVPEIGPTGAGSVAIVLIGAIALLDGSKRNRVKMA
jgi:hypothetical protein